MVIGKKRYRRNMIIVGSVAGTSTALAVTATVMSSISLKKASDAKTTCMNLESELDIKMASHDRQLKEIGQAVRDVQCTLVDNGLLR